MKITIIGKGLAGSLAVSHFSKFLPNYEIDWIFDSNIKTQSVGEGSLLSLPTTLFSVFGFSFYKDLPKELDGTIKYGIRKQNWGENTKDFFHDFPPPNVGIHFNAKKLQDYVCNNISKKVNVNIIDSNIKINNIDADYIFDCSGTPKNFSNYTISEYIPVNSVYVNQCYWDGPRFNYTLAIARPYGWVFGIPLTNRCSIGYLYNKNINTLQDIKEDIKHIFQEHNLEPSDDYNSVDFKSYYHNQNFTNRVGHDGNASFFLEPLEALSTAMIDYSIRNMFDLISCNVTYQAANNRYNIAMTQMENNIMFHYLAGSVFDTEFWNFAKNRANECLGSRLKTDDHFNAMYNEIRNISDHTFLETRRNVIEYGFWWQGSFIQNFRAMDLFSTVDKMLQDVQK